MNRFFGLALAVGALGAGVYLTLHRGTSLSGSRRRRSLRGADEVRELQLYIANDGQLYHQQRQPIEKNLQKKIAKGIFDRTKAEKLWMYLVESGAKKYMKNFGGPGDQWHKVFSMADRKAVAKALNDDFMEEQG